MTRRALGRCLLALLLPFGVVTASDPPDSDLNPVTGSIESVETVSSTGGGDIRHSIDPGQGAPTVAVLLTSNAVPDLSPRMAIRTDGRTAVTWWRDADIDRVLLRTRNAATHAWSAETVVSDPSANARRPEVVAVGSSFWIVFEADAGGGATAIQVRRVIDDPVPIVTIAPSVTFGGDLDAMVHHESGSLWVTWIDGAADVGWSAYDAANDLWSAPDLESYAADSIDDARDRIRTTILGN